MAAAPELLESVFIMSVRGDARYGPQFGRRRTARLFPEPEARASNAPGPMLLLRDFFLDAARVLATSIVAFSLSIAFLGETPLVDLRGRRVAGTVASPSGAIAADGLRTASV